MRIHAAVLALLIAVAPALGSPTRSSPIAVVAGATGDVVFVVNPDSDTVARIAYAGHDGGAAPTHEAAVGRYPRTLAVAGPYVFTADQKSDTVSRLDQADLGNRRQLNLGLGCAPYGVAATPDGSTILVSCQGTSEVVGLDLELTPLFRAKLAHRNARAIAISDRAADAGKAYVSHYLTEEPGTSGHVSVVDLGTHAVTGVVDLPADTTTCETQNSGQGVLNLVSALALVPDTAPAEVRGQLLGRRDAGERPQQGALQALVRVQDRS